MSLMTAFKAFWHALYNPEETRTYLSGESKPKPKQIESQDPAHLKLLAILQQSGRLVDFLKEDITAYSDAQVGAAVRKIHADCSKSLEDLVTIRPVMADQEGAVVTVPVGYDPDQIKIVGKVKGEPPYKGTVLHTGWKACKRSLPHKQGSNDVIHPAEIEIK